MINFTLTFKKVWYFQIFSSVPNLSISPHFRKPPKLSLRFRIIFMVHSTCFFFFCVTFLFFSFHIHVVHAHKCTRVHTAAAAAKSLQSCPTLCDPVDGSPPGSPIPGILQARTLEWVAISFSSARKWKGKVKSLSRVQLFPTPWTAAYQAPPSMGFSRQEYWSGLPLPSLESTHSHP